MKKTLKKKIRIPLPKQVSKVQTTDKKKHSRDRIKRADYIMKMMGWSE